VECCRSKKKHHNSNSNRSIHNHHNNEHYTSGIPVAVPERKKYISKSKRNSNKKNLKQKLQQLKQQDNKKNLDPDRCHQTVEDDTCTVSTESCSNSTLDTYDDTESTSVTILCAPFIETTTSNTDESINNNDDNKRVVRFDMNVNEQYEIESHMNFSNKERSNYWYNSREKDKTMEKLERLIVKYEKRVAKTTKPSSSKKKTLQQNSSNSYYFSGFDSWTTIGSQKLDLDIKQCRNSVIEEQNKQWNDNIIEYEYAHDCDYYDLLQLQIQMIAECSMKVTTDSARRAHLNGLEVAQEARQLIGESWVINKDSDEDSTGAKKGGRKLLRRHDSLLKRGRRSMSRNNNKDNDTLSSMKDNPSTMPSKPIITKMKKNKQKMIASNNEKEEGVVVSTTTKLKKKKSKSGSKSSKTTKKSSLSLDPPGNHLLVQQEE